MFATLSGPKTTVGRMIRQRLERSPATHCCATISAASLLAPYELLGMGVVVSARGLAAAPYTATDEYKQSSPTASRAIASQTVAVPRWLTSKYSASVIPKS